MARVVVIGAGVMGLAATYHALRAGHLVTLLEAAPEPGGMAAHFDLAGVSIERFYHFICKSDSSTFRLLEQLGLSGKVRWTTTTMGYFIGGALHPWGDPVSLLRYPQLGWVSKLRYGLLMFLCTRRQRWDELEHLSAKDWITRWCGSAVYERLWKPLFDLKFHEFADPISAAWVWTRIRRVGRSRRSLFQEELGHLDGGSETLIAALMQAIASKGGTVCLGEGAREVMCEEGRVVGVRSAGRVHPADRVICTVPVIQIPRLVPALPDDWKARYGALANIGVACLVFRLRRSVTPHFWVNIADPRLPIPGIIEFSNLRPVGGDAIVYVPYYMPASHPKFSWPDQDLLAEAFACLRALNPSLGEGDIIASHVSRLRHAQPVCPPGFAATIPPVETPIAGLQIADTCFYYPEDRGISESVRLGQRMAAALSEA